MAPGNVASAGAVLVVVMAAALAALYRYFVRRFQPLAGTRRLVAFKAVYLLGLLTMTGGFLAAFWFLGKPRPVDALGTPGRFGPMYTGANVGMLGFGLVLVALAGSAWLERAVQAAGE